MRPWRPLWYSGGRRFFGFGLAGADHRARILALCGDVAIDQLYDRHRGGIAVAETGLEDAAIAAGARLVALGQRRHHLVGDLGVLQGGQDLTPRVQAAALAERDELLDHRTQVLRLGERGGDLLVLQQRMGHVVEHGLAVGGFAAEAAAAKTMAHGQYGSSRRFASSSMFSGGQFGISMPRWSPICASTSLISLSDLRPKFGVRSMSASVFCTRSPI